MINKHPLLILLVFSGVSNFLPITTSQVNYRECHQTCSSAKPFPYPFGFSSGCAIRLNCTPDGGASVGEFPVHSVSSDSIIVSIEAQCNRPFESFHQLFSHKYAPTSGNVILLQNCTETFLPCSIPETLLPTQLDSEGCNSSSGRLSCYFENRTRGFVSYLELDRIGCKYFTSSISSDDLRNTSGAAVSLEVATIELGWWIHGVQCLCSDHANCTKLQSPIDGKPGFRCRCNEGFVGDGFLAGTGCRKGQFFLPCFFPFSFNFLIIIIIMFN